MGKLDQFLIQFDNNPGGVYYAGQQINGSVLISLREGMKMRGIRLRFEGKATTQWTEHVHKHHHAGQAHHGSHTETVHYHGEEIYVETGEIVLWGTLSGDGQVLGAGSYRYPFQFMLPPNCPTSFEGSHGNIRYTVKVTIDKPWKFDHTAKVAFTVIGLQDLNLDPTARMPVETQRAKKLGVACCTSGEISAHVRLPKKGFVGGEILPIYADVTNGSSRAIKRVEAKLVQHTSFQANRRGVHMGVHAPMHKTKQESRTLVLVDLPNSGEIPAGESRQWEGQGLQIPPLPPMLLNCNIIHNSYELKFEVVPHGPSFSMDLKLPITVGTIPLRDQFSQFQQGFNDGQSGGAMPSAPIMPTETQQQYPDLPPPSYQECMMDGRADIRDERDNEYTRGDMSFAPKYTYYDWSQSGFQTPGPSAPVKM